jgi:hypothetical protein
MTHPHAAVNFLPQFPTPDDFLPLLCARVAPERASCGAQKTPPQQDKLNLRAILSAQTMYRNAAMRYMGWAT